MDWKIWFTEHSVEIASLIVAIIGFWVAGTYLIKINNKQHINLINSPNSPIIQAGGNVSSSDMDTFRGESKKEVALSEEIIKEENIPKKQIKKIEDYLDDNKNISLIAEMSLRLANELRMDVDKKWLEKEVYGFREYLTDEILEKGLQMRKSDEKFKHRKVDAELNIMTKGNKIEKFDVPIFFSESLKQIEDLAEKYYNEQKVIMNAPPMALMVETLKVDPRKDVPYLVNPSSFKTILNKVRLKIIDFIDRAKEKVD